MEVMILESKHIFNFKKSISDIWMSGQIFNASISLKDILEN